MHDKTKGACAESICCHSVLKPSGVSQLGAATHSWMVSVCSYPQRSRAYGRWQQWIKPVQRLKARWKGSNKHLILCSNHFTANCFEPDKAKASSLGLDKPWRRRRANVSAVFRRAASSLEGGATCKHLAGEGPSSDHSRFLSSPSIRVIVVMRSGSGTRCYSPCDITRNHAQWWMSEFDAWV